MKGFDNKALILFPKLESYEGKPFNYTYQFGKAVNNLVAYLKSIDIEPHVFYTDDVARKIGHEDFVWVSPLNKADRFFISKYCDDCIDALRRPMIEHPELVDAIVSKDPGEPDMTVEDRFEMVIRHINKAVTKIIPEYKIVIHFVVANNSQYKVITRPNDGKIRINVKAVNFSPAAYLSGVEENICDLLNLSCASRCLDLWEVRS